VKRKETLSTAESCTGGYISHLITMIPGSSKYFEGAIAAYSYDIKEKLLNVKHETLNSVGAVSEETVIEMTKGLLEQTGTTYGIAVSGIAGPGGGTTDKPVGTVWIAVGNRDSIQARCYHLTQQREYNIKISAQVALNMLRNFILHNES
ncbi:MAG: nicotinamide-nucleotide amidase, partial [Bacteroidia bacterium]